MLALVVAGQRASSCMCQVHCPSPTLANPSYCELSYLYYGFLIMGRGASNFQPATAPGDLPTDAELSHSGIVRTVPVYYVIQHWL